METEDGDEDISTSSTSRTSVSTSRIADQISRLLQVYGAEAVECLETLQTLLKERVELASSTDTTKVDITHTNRTSTQADSSDPAATRPLQVRIAPTSAPTTTTMLMTMGNLDSIVLQTLQMEQQQHHQEEEYQSQDEMKEMEALIQAGIGVLRYWACLQEQLEKQQQQQQILNTPGTTKNNLQANPATTTNVNDDRTPAPIGCNPNNQEDDKDSMMLMDLIIDTLCELMTKYPQNETIQEAACVRLSKQSSLLPKATSTVADGDEQTTTTTTTTRSTSTIQRVLFPVLQAMNWHKNNPTLWNGGMIVLTRLLVKSSSSDDLLLTERQSQAMTLIELTGGLNIFFDALLKQTSKTKANNNNKSTIQTELKVNVCRALAALAINHPTNQALIAQQPGLSTLLDTMKLFAFYVPLQQSLLQLLASLAYGPESKSILLAKGGLDCILTTMKDHHLEPTIQATGCRAIANVFAGTSSDIRAKGSLCIKPTLRAMRMHPPQHVETLEMMDSKEGKADGGNNNEEKEEDEDENLSSVQIHFYGCAALRNLSKVHSRAVVESGGIATLLVTLAEYPNRPAIQEQAWGALYGILRNGGTKEDCLSVCTEGGLDLLLQMLRHYSGHRQIQTVGLGCLACLSSTGHVPTLERIVSGKALDLVLAALHRYHKQGPSELLQNGLMILANLTQDNPDFQLAVIIKNGINVTLMVLQQAKKDPRVQLAACRTICHLVRNPDNLQQFAGGGKKSSNGAILPTLLAILQSHPNHAELNACVIEILSLLATMPEFQKELVSRKGLEIVIEAMKRNDPKSSSTSSSRSLVATKEDDDTKERAAQTLILQAGVTFLSHASENHDATLWMKNNEMLYLQSLEKQLPRRSPTRSNVRDLIQHLQNTRVFLAKFSGLASRRRNGR